MNKFHVAVVGSRPTKTGNRNDPFPQANHQFVIDTLERVAYDQYGALYHGATGYGVDEAVESYAQANRLTQRQFPAYWFDVTKEKNFNKSAGIASREAMIRKVSDATYNKADTYGMLLIFHTQETAQQDEGLKALIEFVTKYHSAIQIRTFRLPVTEVPKEQPMLNLKAEGSGIPDPFTVPQ